MSYESAKKSFKQNMDILELINPGKQPAEMPMWNLSAGLLGLTEALQSDLSEMRKVLVQLSRRPRRVK